MNFKKAGLWAILALGIVGAVGWRFVVKAQSDSALGAGGKGGAKPSPLVDSIVVGSGTILKTIDSVCSLEAPFRVQLSPTVSGILKTITVREGDAVKKGQTLATIDPADAQSALAQAVANLAQARSRYTQAKLTQSANDVGVTSQVEQVQASLTSSDANDKQVKATADEQIAAAHSLVVDATSKLAQSKAQVSNAKAVLSRESATARNLKIKFDRTTDLYNQRFAAAQDVDDAKTAWQAQVENVGVAQAQLDAANLAVKSAQASLDVANNNEQIAKNKAKSDSVAADAQLNQVKSQLKTAKSNTSQTPAYKQNLDALNSAVKAAQAQVTQAQVKVNNTNLRSTIDGSVTNRMFDPGALASPGSPVLVVQYLDWLYVTTSIPIEDSQNLAVGQEAIVSLDDVSGAPISGRVVELNQAADPSSRQFLLRARIENPSHTFRPGWFGRIKLVTGTIHADVVVPKEAIKKSASGASTVYLLNSDMKVTVQPVEIGATDGVIVEIKSGLKSGDRIVSRTFDVLKDGQSVKLPGVGGDKKGGKEKAGSK